MALVKRLEKITKERPYVHKTVECNYFVVTDSKGEKYLTLDTFGSIDRQLKGKASQTIQFNRDSMKQLYKILKDEFNIS